MGYRKIYMAIDCRNEDEAQKVQKIAEDLSTMFALSARDIISIYPSVKSNSGLIKTAIKTLSKEGLRGVGKVVTYMMSNFKKS
jgi:hypothetical protein